jgi:hypothetical protein
LQLGWTHPRASASTRPDRSLDIPQARAILSGAAWPAPFGEKLEALTPDDVPRSLHCIGTLDTVSPPNLGLKLAGGCRIVAHPAKKFSVKDPRVLSCVEEIFLSFYLHLKLNRADL